ncbi:hypothetical protein FRC17_002277, partial [Serendipita sp. 399]
LRDLIEDVDAFNIAKRLLADPSRTIVQEIEDLFGAAGGYKTRFSRFLDGKFGGTTANVIKSATKVLTSEWDPLVTGGRSGLIKNFGGPNVKMPYELNPLELESFCQGFAEVLTQLAASE